MPPKKSIAITDESVHEQFRQLCNLDGVAMQKRATEILSDFLRSRSSDESVRLFLMAVKNAKANSPDGPVPLYGEDVMDSFRGFTPFDGCSFCHGAGCLNCEQERKRTLAYVFANEPAIDFPMDLS